MLCAVALVVACSSKKETPKGAQPGNTASPREAPPNEPVVVRDGNLAFIVQAPPGWVLDTKHGLPEALLAVAYQAGQSFASADVVLYVRPHPELIGQPIEAVIASRAHTYRTESRNAPNIGTPKPIKTRSGAEVPVRSFSGDIGGNYEHVAYIVNPDEVLYIVLTTRNETAYKDAIPAFRSFVGSFTSTTAASAP